MLAIRQARLELLMAKTPGLASLAQLVLGLNSGIAAVEVEALLIEALARHRCGSDPSAPVRAALSRARAEACWQPFAVLPRAEIVAVSGFLPEADRAQVSNMLRGMDPVMPAELHVIVLTDREKVVLNRLASSLSMAEIARAEFVSVNTIKTQIRTLYGKLGGADRESAVRTARAEGLLPG